MTQPNAGTRKYSVPAISVHTSSPRTCKREKKREAEEKMKKEEEVGTEKKVITIFTHIYGYMYQM